MLGAFFAWFEVGVDALRRGMGLGDETRTIRVLIGCCWFLGEWGGVELLRY